MRPDPFFSDLPDREDLGVDEDYCEFMALRCLFFATLFSLPIWALIGYGVYRLCR